MEAPTGQNTPFLAPLNDCNSIVCGPSQFGPVQVESCIIDSGCTSLLLPWPTDPDQVLAPLLANPCLKCAISLAGGVGSDHVTFVVRAPGPMFEVVLDGHRVHVFVADLRFVVTEEARHWLVFKDATLWRKQYMDVPVHSCNLDYALIGQTVLSQLLCLQVYDKGMLILRSATAPDLGDPCSNVSDLARLAADLYRAEISSPHYDKLRDLHVRERKPDGSSPLRSSPRLIPSVDRADMSSFGRRMDRFGVGRLKFC